MARQTSTGGYTEVITHDLVGADADVVGLDKYVVKNVYCEVDWVGLTGVLNATAQPQMSSDKINWTNVGTVVTMGTANAHAFITDIGDFPAHYLRIKFVKGTTTAGVVRVTVKGI